MDDIDPEIHPCINSHSIDDVCDYYDNVLNLDKTTYKIPKVSISQNICETQNSGFN